MAAVIPGKMTVEVEGDFVVFLIGMRINKPWKLHKWLPVFLAMPRLLKELAAHPEAGCLGTINGLSVIVQYWRSFEHLEAFAKDTEDPHLEVWRQYWKRVGKDARSGIWHETFLVRAGEYEAIYGNMPPTGLGKATTLVPVAESTMARQRLKAASASPGT